MKERGGIFLTIVTVVCLIFLVRLFFIQVLDESYLLSAERNAIRKVTVYPSRGLIYDRNGELVVINQSIYDLMIVPSQISKTMDTAVFCNIFQISKEVFIEKVTKAKLYSRYKPSVFQTQLSNTNAAHFQEIAFQFPGFFTQSRTVRKYPKPVAAALLGYIGEVDDKAIEASNNYYQKGDYFGIAGLEYQYEEYLRGTRGVKYVYVDVFNREKGKFKNGELDSLAVSGEELHLSLDLRLQEYAEKLMVNKRGSVVAIEPSTGEILAFVSAPTYDPNMLVGANRGKGYRALIMDPFKPLFNRPIQARYPPGSMFKLAQGVLANHLGLIDLSTHFPCGGAYYLGGIRVGCHSHPGGLDLNGSIQHSCNPYYCAVFRKIMERPGMKAEDAYIDWRNYMGSFGFGDKLGIDIPNEGTGLLPKPTYYDKIYGKGRWKFSTIISLSIGQGELGVTPLQMANFIATYANHGYYYRPHFVKAIGKDQKKIDKYITPIVTPFDTSLFTTTLDGLQAVTESGTARQAAIKGIPVLGKTGTVQNPHGRDHAVFVGYAPRENPRIAIAVIVENSGFGGTWAAPIASLLMELYLNDSISRPALEKKMVEADFIYYGNPPNRVATTQVPSANPVVANPIAPVAPRPDTTSNIPRSPAEIRDDL